MVFRRLLFFAAIAFVALGVVGCKAAPKEPGRYYDRGNGFSIKFPEKWKKISSLAGAVITMQDPGETIAFSITAQRVLINSSAEELLKMVTSQAQQRGITYKDRGQMTLDGHDAYWMMGDAGVQSYVYLVYFILWKNRWYSLQFVTDSNTFTQSQQDFAQIAGTLKLE